VNNKIKIQRTFAPANCSFNYNYTNLAAKHQQ